MSLKVRRLAPGHYISRCGRATIRRVFSGILKNDPWWTVLVDGSPLGPAHDTKAAAVRAAERELARKDGVHG